MRSQTYEITFTGQPDVTLRAEFDDCAIAIGPGKTTLYVRLPDQDALLGLVQRITGLGLEVVHLHLVAPPPPTRPPALRATPRIIPLARWRQTHNHPGRMTLVGGHVLSIIWDVSSAAAANKAGVKSF